MTHTRAMLSALVGFFLWVLVGTAIKLGGQAALSPFVIMALLGMIGAACVAGRSSFKRSPRNLLPTCWRTQAWVVLCYVGFCYSNVVAFTYLPLTVFYTVVFTTPLVVAALSAFLKQEVLSPIKIVCVIVGFLGVLLAIVPSLTVGGELVGYVAVLSGVVFFASYSIIVNKISKKTSVESILFFNSLAAGIIGVVGAASQPFVMPEGWALIMMGVAAGINILGNAFYNIALQNTTSTNVAQLHYTQIIYAGIIGYLIWHEIPSWNLIAGSFIIISAGLVVAAQARKGDGIVLPFGGGFE